MHRAERKNKAESKVLAELYHVIPLSNLVRGYDKYSGTYSKKNIAESTFPGEFYLLERDQIHVGLRKVNQSIAKHDRLNDIPIILQTEVDPSQLKISRSGSGHYIEADTVKLSAIFTEASLAEKATSPSNASSNILSDLFWSKDVTGHPVPFLKRLTEDMIAKSYALSSKSFVAFDQMQTRSISYLPIANACQADCPFCFSNASISKDQIKHDLNFDLYSNWTKHAIEHGATRAVITGGGEPTLLKFDKMLSLISMASKDFSLPVTLITNAHIFASCSTNEQDIYLDRLGSAGLSTLSISRHHYDHEINASIMKLRTPLGPFLSRAASLVHGSSSKPKIRLVCVLQKGGIESLNDLEDYLDWGVHHGVQEFCFKELYISTSTESVYHDQASNEWSRANQVPLSLVSDLIGKHGSIKQTKLPWGAPVYSIKWKGELISVAAYTEPSLYWERANGLARSWNLMADGRCYASLEDKESDLNLETIGGVK